MRKNKLLLLLALLLTAATGAMAQDYYAPSTDEVIILNDVYDASKSGRSSHSAIAWGGTASTSDKKAGDPNNGGQSTSSPVSCYSVKGNGKGKNITLSITGVSKVIVYHEKHSTRYIELRDGSKTGDIIGSGQTNTWYTEVALTATNQYSIFLHGTSTGSDDQDFYVYAIKLIAAPAASGYTVSMKDGVKDADKWTVKVGDGQAQALPIGGLKGDGSETVTLQYNGRLKVKGVKATSEAGAPAEEPVPMEFVEFTNGTKKVKFANMNLGATSVADGTSSYGDYYAWAATEPFGTVSYTAYNAGTVTPTKEGGYSAANAPYRSGNTYSKYTSYGAILEAMDDAVTVKMGEGYRMPTMDDFSTLCAACGGTDADIYISSIATGAAYAKGIYWVEGAETAVTVGGDEYKTNGVLFVQDADHHVFFPCAGFVNENNQFVYDGYYWSSTLITDTQANHYLDAHYMRLNQYYVGHGNQYCIDRQSGFPIRPVQEVPAEAKEPATVTTAPTGAAIVGVGKTTALVSGGEAAGGTMMYKVTTENTKPTSTDGFSDAVPTAKDITASGKVYVWYYVKGDDTHSDSEIAATAIEVPVADIVWDITNISDLEVYGTDEYVKEGVKLSGNVDDVDATWNNSTNPTKVGIIFSLHASGGFTFTAPTGKAFTKIEMMPNGPNGWDTTNLGSGWAFNNLTVTWTGSAASTVKLLTDVYAFNAAKVKSIAFYLSE